MYYQELSSKWLGPMIAQNGRSKSSQLTFHRTVVLILTFLVYASFHASRRPLAIVKSELHKNCTSSSLSSSTAHSSILVENINSTKTISTQLRNETKEEELDCGWKPFDGSDGKTKLGTLDSCYLFMYAFCMFFAGYFAERSNIRYFLSTGLVLTGLVSIVFGLGYSFKIHQMWFFVLVQLIFGIVQTSGWPSVVAVVGEWFGTSKKGLIMGLWNWHTNIGNIIGTALAGAFVDNNWGMSFIVPGILNICMGILTFIAIIPSELCYLYIIYIYICVAEYILF